jgi:hypothetical protein
VNGTLDLQRLGEVHPRLPSARADELGECAALALEAGGHEPGTALTIDFLGHREAAPVDWAARGAATASMRDAHRITEDGADGLTLAVIGAKRWRLVRRLQRGTFADWLVADEMGTERALEVAGTADDDLGKVLRREREQVDRSPYSARSVCVIRFADPRLVMEHRP